MNDFFRQTKYIKNFMQKNMKKMCVSPSFLYIYTHFFLITMKTKTRQREIQEIFLHTNVYE